MAKHDATRRRIEIERPCRLVMSVRSQSLSEARLSLVAMLAVRLIAAPTAHAQNVNGSLAVSATILPPAPGQETRLTAFTVGRDGIARMETTTSIAAPVSRIVMWSVSSSANGFVPVTQAPVRIQAAQHRDSEDLASSLGTRQMRLRFGVDLGGTGSSSPADSSVRDVTVRIHYLIVPAT
jgi:hypothetical protein